MRTTFVRRNAVKLSATVALVAGAAAVAGVGTFGQYTDTTIAEASVSSGKVSVLMNGEKEGFLAPVTDMKPGDSATFPVTIQREPGSSKLGGLALETEMTDNALTDALRLTVGYCDDAHWNAAAKTCSSLSHVWTGALTEAVDGDASIDEKSGSGLLDYLNVDNNTINMLVTLALPESADNTTADLTTTIDWTLTGIQQAGEHRVITPTDLPSPATAS